MSEGTSDDCHMICHGLWTRTRLLLSGEAVVWGATTWTHAMVNMPSTAASLNGEWANPLVMRLAYKCV